MPIARRTRIEPLDCIVVDGGTSPKIAVVICHGYGASYDDLAPLSGEWIGMLGDRAGDFRFVFPDAPGTLAELGMPQGRAWWPLDMVQLAEAMQTSRFDELFQHEPPGIDEVRAQLCQTIRRVKEDLGGDTTPLVLGGFSQGAMLAMDASLRGEIGPPVRLFQFSSMLICGRHWQAALPRLAETTVFQSHGMIDPVLPYAGATALHEVLTEAGIDVDFHSFVGPHTIDPHSVSRTAELLATLAGDGE